MALIDLGNVKGDTGPQGPKGDTGEWSGASNLIYTDGVTVVTQDTPIS